MGGGTQQGVQGRIALLILDVSRLDAYAKASPLQLPPCQGKSLSGPSGDSFAMLWVGEMLPGNPCFSPLATGRV